MVGEHSLNILRSLIFVSICFMAQHGSDIYNFVCVFQKHVYSVLDGNNALYMSVRSSLLIVLYPIGIFFFLVCFLCKKLVEYVKIYQYDCGFV